jgi:hypothetical protein
MNKLKDMKFDYIVQNPPYSRSLHLTFFEKSLDFLKDDGEMVIIEPATWLINVRRNGKAKIYDNIKKLIKGHVKSIRIENLNNEFQTNCFVLFSITKIDNSKEYSEIEYTCCGANTTVANLYDCNLIGSYELIWSILNKVQKYGDMMKNHCTSNAIENSWYCKYPYLMPSTFTPHGIGAISDREYANDNNFIGKYNLLFSYYYYSLICKDITSYIPFKKGPCGKITEEKVKSCLYGTHAELVNFNYYINENKLPLFIIMVMTIAQNNNSLPYIPWLVNKIYTDDEINKLFNFTEDEINLIDKTIKKFERHSLWFKRYMCGPSSVSDEDVQKDLKEKGIC